MWESYAEVTWYFSRLQGSDMRTSYNSTILAKLHTKYTVRNKHAPYEISICTNNKKKDVSYEISICNNNENRTLQRSTWNLTNSIQWLEVKCLQQPCSSNTELRSIQKIKQKPRKTNARNINFHNLILSANEVLIWGMHISGPSTNLQYSKIWGKLSTFWT
jgi:hypothetical protein